VIEKSFMIFLTTIIIAPEYFDAKFDKKRQKFNYSNADKGQEEETKQKTKVN
jgi:hypothetical protein